jgi:hypothetical protein
MTIVFVETEERAAQNIRAINPNYQCSLLVEIDNNRVDVYQDHCYVETFQNRRCFFVFIGTGCGFHSGPSPDMSKFRPPAK